MSNGKFIPLWNDRWITDFPLNKPLAGSESVQRYNLVLDLINFQSNCLGSPMLGQEFSKDIVEAIMCILLCPLLHVDKLVWKASHNSCYSVKSGYHVAFPEFMHEEGNGALTLFGWSLKLIPKIHIFLWNVALDSLALGEELVKQITVSPFACFTQIS